MENLTQQQADRLKRSIKYWFNQMYKEYVDLDQFIESLEDWQDYLRKKANDQSKLLYFTFYTGDKLTGEKLLITIEDIKRDLNPNTCLKGNLEKLTKCINIALIGNSFQINF